VASTPHSNGVDNGTLTWFDLDLPDVIELRSRYIREEQRRNFIACSILDDKWMDRVKVTDAVLFVAAGVLYYFEEAQVKALLSTLADRFPGSELIFDACSPRGLRIANKRVIEDGGMDVSAQLRWGVAKAIGIQRWDGRITVVDEYPIFRGLKGTLSLKEKWGTFLSDTLRIMSMIHLRMSRC
jgi:O-methyltransferase involved in polyketide biosynthesis